jgi:hypothetical protein
MARSNRSSVSLAVRPVFERIAGEIGQSPEFACAFLSSQIVRELVKAGRKGVEIDSKVDTENVALLLYQAFLGTLTTINAKSTAAADRNRQSRVTALVLSRNPTLRTRGSHRLPSVSGRMTVRKKRLPNVVSFGTIGVSK